MNWSSILKNILPAYAILIFLLYLAPACTGKAPSSKSGLDFISLPYGFKIEVYAESIKNARAMSLSPSGILFVGSRSEGKVYAIPDHDNNFKGDTVITIAEGLNMPVGVSYYEGDLYISSVSKILRIQDIESNLLRSPKAEVINESFPDERHHGWKFIDFGPDGKLYVPVGAPCNICLKEDNRYASIMRMDKDGSNLELFASGVRNTVGFTWHPQTKEMWFTDNGRDWLGDDAPSDELNCAPKKGMHFGYPFCHAGDISDPKYGKKRECSEFTPPSRKLGPHVASLGLTFYNGTQFPKEYQGKIFIAEHGSWNRSTKTGYRISMVALNGNQAIDYKIFAKGWEKGGNVEGRPVDVLELTDGSLLVSDDYADKIYRIYYAP